MTTTRVVKYQSPPPSLSKDHLHPDNHTRQTTHTSGLKPFTIYIYCASNRSYCSKILLSPRQGHCNFQITTAVKINPRICFDVSFRLKEDLKIVSTKSTPGPGIQNPIKFSNLNIFELVTAFNNSHFYYQDFQSFQPRVFILNIFIRKKKLHNSLIYSSFLYTVFYFTCS